MNESDSIVADAGSPSVMPELAVSDLREAWRSAVRCYNTCENSGLSDTCTALAEIIVKLSQQLDYTETTLAMSKESQ